MEKQSIEELIYSETEQRLHAMEQRDYEFPEQIGKMDVIAIVGGVLISGLLIILCMTGVIQ